MLARREEREAKREKRDVRIENGKRETGNGKRETKRDPNRAQDKKHTTTQERSGGVGRSD
jgi:hypothetical protein